MFLLKWRRGSRGMGSHTSATPRMGPGRLRPWARLRGVRSQWDAYGDGWARSVSFRRSTHGLRRRAANGHRVVRTPSSADLVSSGSPVAIAENHSANAPSSRFAPPAFHARPRFVAGPDLPSQRLHQLVLQRPVHPLHTPRRVVGHHHQHCLLTPALEPVVIQTIHLHNLPQVLLPLTAATMRFHLAQSL
jgi:hypothetical protein